MKQSSWDIYHAEGVNHNCLAIFRFHNRQDNSLISMNKNGNKAVDFYNGN